MTATTKVVGDTLKVTRALNVGGYARYVAVCPADWGYGVTVGQVPEAPLPRSDRPLHWDPEQGMRVRD